MDAANMTGPAERSKTGALRAARLLGWTSFGLAAAMLIAPRRITETFGLEGKENWVRGFGAQELLSGVGALSVDAAPAMWGRALGDVARIGALATGLQNEDEDKQRKTMIGLAALTGFLVVNAMVASKLSGEQKRSRGEFRDFSHRSGFPKRLEASRGAAVAEGSPIKFETPADMRAVIPEPPSYAPA